MSRDRWLLAAAGGLAAALIGTLLAAGRSSPGRHGDPFVRDGSLVQATGRVMRTADGSVLFCPSLALVVFSLPAVQGGETRRPLLDCPLDSIRVRGADLDRLLDRQDRDGRVAGGATLRGVYAGGVLTVTRQSVPAELPVWQEAPVRPAADPLPADALAVARPLLSRLAGTGLVLMSTQQAGRPDGRWLVQLRMVDAAAYEIVRQLPAGAVQVQSWLEPVR